MEVIKAIVKTNAGKSEIVSYDEEKKAYRVAVKAQPEKGKANQEVLKLFRKKFKKEAKIISGFTSKEKLLRLTDTPNKFEKLSAEVEDQFKKAKVSHKDLSGAIEWARKKHS